MTKIYTKIFAVLTVLFVSACNVLADVKSDGYEAPEIKAQGTWINWVFFVVFAVAVIAIAVKNPKRSHLD